MVALLLSALVGAAPGLSVDRVRVELVPGEKPSTLDPKVVETWFTETRTALAPCGLRAIKESERTKYQSSSLKALGWVVVANGANLGTVARLQFRVAPDGRISYPDVRGDFLDGECAAQKLTELRFTQSVGEESRGIVIWLHLRPEISEPEVLLRQAREEVPKFCTWLSELHRGNGPKEVAAAIKKDPAHGFRIASAAWSEREDLSPFSRMYGSVFVTVNECDRILIFDEVLGDLEAPWTECPALVRWTHDDLQRGRAKCGKEKFERRKNR